MPIGPRRHANARGPKRYKAKLVEPPAVANEYALDYCRRLFAPSAAALLQPHVDAVNSNSSLGWSAALYPRFALQVPTPDYLGLADGVSVARVRTCRYSKRPPRRWWRIAEGPAADRGRRPKGRASPETLVGASRLRSRTWPLGAFAGRRAPKSLRKKKEAASPTFSPWLGRTSRRRAARSSATRRRRSSPRCPSRGR